MMKRYLPSIFVCLLVALPLRAADTVTFNNQVVRIFQQQCQSCHRPGNIAPFSLLTFNDAVAHAGAIRSQVVRKEMPPWKPVGSHGVFKDERTLTEFEIQTIVQWIDGGMVEGSGADLPEAIQFPREWTLSEPDRVVQPDGAYQLDPAGGEIYRCFTMPVNSTVDLNVRGYEVLPGNREIVHHVLLFVDRTGVSASLDAADSGPGYTCFGGPGFIPDTALGGWVPGMRPEMFPIGTGVTVPAGSRIVMQVHYSPLGHVSHPHETDGPPAPDRTKLGLFFSPSSLRQIAYVPVVNPLFLIPAGAERHKVTASTPIPVTVELTSVTPHMHLLGKEVLVEAQFPDRTKKELVHIDNWDFEWQAQYTFREPVLLPAGTIVTMTAYYDNSAANSRNPSSPPKAVFWGERTTDEMCLTFLTVTTPGSRPMTQVPFSVADRGGVEVRSAGEANAASIGYARVSSQAGQPTPEGLAIFGYRQNNVLVSETTVSASSMMRAGRIFAETAGSIKTGLALANPGTETASVSFYFTDATGAQLATGSTTIAPGNQLAKFLDEAPFNGPRSAFYGTFTFISTQPVSVVALRGNVNSRSEFIMTTLPVIDTSLSTTSSTVVFPHFANGGGWTTQIQLVNPTDNTLSGTFRFVDPSGQPMFVNLEDSSVVNGTYAIPPRAAIRIRLIPPPSSPVRTGSVWVSPANGAASPAGSLVFSYGATEAGIAALPAKQAFRLYTESNEGGSVQSGFAVTNTSSTAAKVNLELTNLNGSAAARASLTLPANGQAAMFLNQVPGFESLRLPFQGVLRVSSESPVSVVGLRSRYNERSDFLITTTSPVAESMASTTDSRYFAHFVDGGGYTTQFIVFSNSTQAAGGTLSFFSVTGQAGTVGVK